MPANDPFSRDGAQELAKAMRKAQREMYEHPLSAVHINQGSMDAMADAYDAEYQASLKADPITAKPSAPREAARRSRGRPVSTVLTSPEAIASLDALISKLGGPKAAIEFALAEYKKSRQPGE